MSSGRPPPHEKQYGGKLGLSILFCLAQQGFLSPRSRSHQLPLYTSMFVSHIQPLFLLPFGSQVSVMHGFSFLIIQSAATVSSLLVYWRDRWWCFSWLLHWPIIEKGHWRYLWCQLRKVSVLKAKQMSHHYRFCSACWTLLWRCQVLLWCPAQYLLLCWQ